MTVVYVKWPDAAMQWQAPPSSRTIGSSTPEPWTIDEARSIVPGLIARGRKLIVYTRKRGRMVRIELTKENQE